MHIFTALPLVLLACSLSAQQPASSNPAAGQAPASSSAAPSRASSSSSPVDIQRTAMQKLAFLAGHWTGPLTIDRGQGEPLHFTQAENIQFKLDGLVLLVEGQSTLPDGKPVFSALATVAYDDATHAYRFRAYNGGHYVDTELTVSAHGFSWSYDVGPAHIVNTMHLTQKGEWNETTDATVGANPPHRSVQMLLAHLP
jgi:Neuraminidase (sialidase)